MILKSPAGAVDDTMSTEDAQHWTDFGSWLKQAREAKPKRRVDVYKAAGLSDTAYRRLEEGGYDDRASGEWKPSNPTDHTLRRIADALEIPRREVFERAGREYREPEPSELTDAGARAAVDHLERIEQQFAREMAAAREEIRQLLRRLPPPE